MCVTLEEVVACMHEFRTIDLHTAAIIRRKIQSECVFLYYYLLQRELWANSA